MTSWIFWFLFIYFWTNNYLTSVWLLILCNEAGNVFSSLWILLAIIATLHDLVLLNLLILLITIWWNSIWCFILFSSFWSIVFLLSFQLHVRLLDVMSKLGLQKGSVSRHMSKVIQPILEKGIVDHSILHRVLLEYFSIADKVPLFLSRNNSLWFLLQLRNLVMAIAFSYLNEFFQRPLLQR